MNQKSFFSIVLAIVIAASIAISGYFIFLNKVAAPIPQQVAAPIPRQQASETEEFKWENHLVEVKEILQKEFSGCIAENQYFFSNFNKTYIHDKRDISGDGVDEILIGNGCTSATGGFLSVFTSKNGKPKIVILKDEEGKIYPSNFLDASSASYSERVSLSSEKRGVILTSISYNCSQNNNAKNPEDMVKCSESIEILNWNPETEMLELLKNK